MRAYFHPWRLMGLIITAILITGCAKNPETSDVFSETAETVELAEAAVLNEAAEPSEEPAPDPESTEGVSTDPANTDTPTDLASEVLTAASDMPVSPDTPTDDWLSPPPLTFTPPPEAFEARGMYITSNSAGIPDRMDKYVELCAASGMNAMVIDIRTENEITMTGWLDFADEWGITKNYIQDIKPVLALMEKNGIYPIARMVTFLDGYTSEFRPELYIHNQDGTLWEGPVHNGRRYPWLNPYNRDTWDYVLTYAKAAAELGFKEIQFDYVRFAATTRLDDADFGETGGLSRSEAILAFIQYAVDELRPYGVRVSADVYGTVINSDIDAGIVGQNYTEMAKILDVICPMVYPSHFAGGTYGIAYPDTKPYEIIYQVMAKSAERLSLIPEGEHRAAVRPWLQDFTASYLKSNYLKYGADERQAQIQATYDAGLTEWLLWDPGNHYEAEGVILPPSEAIP